jgi:hypothetical protein
MHTVELIEEAIQLARSLGFNIRQEWLGGAGGGCEIKGQRWIFVDLSLAPLEQLDQVLSAIRPALHAGVPISPQLRRHAA